MPLKGAIIKSGATALTVVGGVDMTFSSTSIPVNGGGLMLIDAAVADYRIRPTLTMKYKPPVYDSKTKTWTKDRKSFQLVQPEILTDGSIVYNLTRFERELHPESLLAKALELNMRSGQIVSDADFTAFWTTGSMD